MLLKIRSCDVGYIEQLRAAERAAERERGIEVAPLIDNFLLVFLTLSRSFTPKMASLSSHHRRKACQPSIDSPIESINTNDDSSLETDESDIEYERIDAKKSLSWDVVIGLGTSSLNSQHNHHAVSREAKLFLLKLFMIPVTAYALTFALWLYRINYDSPIVIYTMGDNHQIVHHTYAPVSCLVAFTEWKI